MKGILLEVLPTFLLPNCAVKFKISQHTAGYCIQRKDIILEHCIQLNAVILQCLLQCFKWNVINH